MLCPKLDVATWRPYLPICNNVYFYSIYAQMCQTIHLGTLKNVNGESIFKAKYIYHNIFFINVYLIQIDALFLLVATHMYKAMASKYMVRSKVRTLS
jgi:hypothetical protein